MVGHPSSLLVVSQKDSHWSNDAPFKFDSFVFTQEQLYKETHPVGMEEDTRSGSDFLSDTISRCSVCLVGKAVSIPAAFSLTGAPENYPLPLLFHEGQMYHPTCANFWINVVQEKLPDLSEEAC